MSNVELGQPVNRPEEYFTVTVNGEKKEIFMSAGLRGRIVNIISTVEAVTALYSTPDIQEAVVQELLMTRDKKGNFVEQTATIDDLSQEESEKLIEWVMGHVLYFFINAAVRSKNLAQENSPLQKLTQLLIGSQDLTENKQSAGPLTQPSAE